MGIGNEAEENGETASPISQSANSIKLPFGTGCGFTKLKTADLKSEVSFSLSASGETLACVRG